MPTHAVPLSRINRFEPDPMWFLCRSSTIHGIDHEARVLIWTQVLAALTRHEGLVVDADVLGWAAAIHDTQRRDDGGDHEHGDRAALWVQQHLPALDPTASVDAVAYVCRYHVPSDSLAPEMTPDLRVFKDADALDRWRIDGPDRAYLRTRGALELWKPSYELWRRTQWSYQSRPETAFAEIVAAAIDLGIMTDAPIVLSPTH